MIKRLRLLIIMLLAFNLVTAPVVRASFDDNGAGGRATGLAGAFVGVADDANSIMYNPAGLVNVKDGELTSEYSQFAKGLDDGSTLGTAYLAFAQPLHQGEKGVMGFAYHNFKAANLLNERTLALSYGWKLKMEPFGWKGHWSLGTTLKQLHRQYEPDRFTENALNDVGTGTNQSDPLFAKNGYASDAYGLDLGALYQFGPKDKYSAGLSIRNANRPDVSLAGDGDKAPMSVKLGLSAKQRWGLISGELRRVKRLENQSDSEYAIGVERRFVLKEDNAFMIRGGYASGSREFKLVTAGASYQLGRAQFDYAFEFPVGNLSDTQGSHRIGFSYRMAAGVPQPEKKKPAPVATPTPVQAPQPEATPEALPEAPTALTAPVPVISSTETAPSLEFDATLKHLGVMLGYYVKRTGEGASVEERRTLLLEMKALYGHSGIDMGYVDHELQSLGDKPMPKTIPAPKPAMIVKPVAAPVATPKPAKMQVPNAEMERAWEYYQQAVARGITDSERVEILENILMRWGESSAGKVVKELEKVRRRLE